MGWKVLQIDELYSRPCREGAGGGLFCNGKGLFIGLSSASPLTVQKITCPGMNSNITRRKNPLDGSLLGQIGEALDVVRGGVFDALQKDVLAKIIPHRKAAG